MANLPTKIFLSVGRTYTPEQCELVRRLYSATEANKLRVVRLNSDEAYYESPLDAISSMLQISYGAIVVAYPRFSYDSGAEYPASANETKLPTRHLTTIWNQIESALILHYRLPILTLVESNVHAEGLLSPRHQQYHVVRFHLNSCQDGLPPAILAEIDAFAGRVRAFQAAKEKRPFCVVPNRAPEVE